MILSIRIVNKDINSDNAIQSLKGMKKGLHLLDKLLFISPIKYANESAIIVDDPKK
jgi:hypothetical protein